MNDELATKSIDQKIEEQIDKVIQDRFAHILEDISFRIEQAYELIARTTSDSVTKGKVFAEDLFLPDRAYLTGYTITNNSPVAGSVAWTDVHVVYNGVDNLITPNANTANKYIWWSSGTPAVLQTSASKPTLTAGDVLLFVNNGGTASVMLSDTNSSLPQMVANLAIDSGSIAASAVTAGKIGTGAVNSPGVFGTGVVDSTAIGASAVSAGKLAAGAINNNTIFTTGVVNTAAIGASAIDNTKLAAGAISNPAHLATGVITAPALSADSVTTTAIGPNAITSTELAAGAVSSSAQIGTGVVVGSNILNNAVTASKLSIMRHLLY